MKACLYILRVYSMCTYMYLWACVYIETLRNFSMNFCISHICSNIQMYITLPLEIIYANLERLKTRGHKVRQYNVCFKTQIACKRLEHCIQSSRYVFLLFTVLDPDIEGQVRGRHGVRPWGTSLLMLDCCLPLDAVDFPEVVKEETTK